MWSAKVGAGVGVSIGEFFRICSVATFEAIVRLKPTELNPATNIVMFL